MTITTSGIWRLSHRADPAARVLADRHYNRRNPNSPQFVPPGSCLVLIADGGLWVTSAPLREYVRHDWAGAWVCTLFRREPVCEHRASDMIRDAVAITRWHYGLPPAEGFVTFVDRSRTRTKRNPGYCYLMAGWEPCGRTKGGLYALRLTANKLRDVQPLAPGGAQDELVFG